MICPPDHSHGENSTCRSLHHCKCDDCREFARMYEYWRAGQKRHGRDLLVDATGTRRRIRALQRLGWSQQVLADQLGMSAPWITHLMRVRRVKPATAERISDLYERLCMTPPPARTPMERASATKARRYAERAGWPSPLAWDDIDDPNEEAA